MATNRRRQHRVRLGKKSKPRKQRQRVDPAAGAERIDSADPSPDARLGHNNPPVSLNDPLILLNPKKTAKVLDMSTVTLATWRINGTGPPFHKLGRSVRYALADLMVWARKQRRGSTSEPS